MLINKVLSPSKTVNDSYKDQTIYSKLELSASQIKKYHALDPDASSDRK